jgi:Mrp family chromosome partitioning ATPase
LINEPIRRLNEQLVALRAQHAEQSSTLLDNHPRMKELKAQIAELVRQIRDEAQRLVRSLENDARIAGARVESLSAGLDQLKRQAGSSSGDDVQLRALERQAKALRDLLDSYLAKNTEATARDNLGAVPSDARIISRAAVSNTPYFPKKLPIVLIATLATLFISAGFITTGELLGGNVYRGTPEPAVVEPRFDAAPAPVAAATVEPAEPAVAPARRSWLPAFSLGKKRAAEPAADVSAAAVAAAPARTDGLSVADLAQGVRDAGDVGKRVAVVGAAAGIGTTMTAVALARDLASDRRVVLVDLALDRPKLATLTPDPRMPGIADLVRGSASFGQIIARDRHSRAQVIPAGRAAMDAGDVIGSERLKIAIDALSRSYDHVIIDANAAPHALDDEIARLAPCAVLVASGLAANKADAVRDHLANAGFTDIAVFTGAAPALDAEAMREVAA